MQGKNIKRKFIIKLLNNINAIEKAKWPQINISTYIETAERLRKENLEISEKLKSGVERRILDKKAFLRSTAYYLSQNPGLPEISRKKIEEDIEKSKWEIFTLSDPDISKIITNLMTILLDYINYDYFERGKKEWNSKVFRGRTTSKVTLGQLFCTEDTVFRRVELITRDFSDHKRKVLFLGDGDLCSLALKSLADFEVHVLDLDRELIKFINSKNRDIKTLVVNFKKGVPEKFYDYFDAIMMDPFWDMGRTEMFLTPALKCIKKNPESRIYMSLCPVVTGEDYGKLQKRILDSNFIFLEIIKHFSYYILANDKGGYGEIINLFKEINEEHIKNEYLSAALNLPVFYSDMHIISPM